jgi:chromosomal replication initiation ATPase DnaA
MIPVDVDFLLARLRRRITAIADDDPQGAAALRDFLASEVERTYLRRPRNCEPARRQAVLWSAELACEAYGVTREEVLGNRRTLAGARARGLAMALCRARYGWSYPETGAAFGRDHTTVISAVSKAKRGPWAHLVETELARAGALG